jgi:folate-binding protein YgfZ
VRREDSFELSTPPERAESLRAALEAYLFSEDVELATTSADHAPLELAGPQATAILARVFDERFDLAAHAERAVIWQDGRVAVSATSVAGSAGYRVDGGAELAGELWNALLHAGARACGLAVRDILRVEAGAALHGVDVDENVYPQEARLEDAFALDKGCFVGQEVVAKIDTYGGLNKRIEALRIEHSDPVQRGTKLFEAQAGDSRELGLVTSWAYSFVLDTGLALAYVKRRHQEPGTEFRLGESAGTRATIVALPVRRGAR